MFIFTIMDLKISTTKGKQLMNYITGYAYTSNEKTIAQDRKELASQASKGLDYITLNKENGYEKWIVDIQVLNSGIDLLSIVYSAVGLFHFGGYFTINGDKVKAVLYTD